MAIMQALSPAMHMAMNNANPITVVDKGTIEIEMGGISIRLTCRQRFMTQSGKAVGYRNIEFRNAPPLKDAQ